MIFYFRFFASVERDGRLDALALWFDCDFNPFYDLQKPVSKVNDIFYTKEVVPRYILVEWIFPG